MGDERLKIGIQMKRGLMFSTRICYRSVCNHPFLVGFVFFLIFLYRSFPFVFSILVSSSPVLVCTILLLGTLLSFGHPHLPEIEKEIEKEVEKEEKITHEIAALKSHSGVLEDAVVVDERGETCDVDRYTGKGVDVVDKATENRGLEDIDFSKVDKDDGLDECAPLIEENSREIHFEKPVIEEEEGESHDFQHGPTEEINGEKPRIQEDVMGESEVEAAENQYTLLKSLEDEDHDVVNDKSPAGVVSALMDDHLLESSWKHLEDDNEPSDSESDEGESSSPDASMTDIMPLLDELHPLLDSEAPQPALVSHDDSDAASELSQSNDGSAESSEDSENQEEDDAVDEGDEEEDNEKEADVTKSVITWTEDDQKNLMDLGTSELERNLRLENLIMRRRSRKNMKAMAEKNLIDLESVDPPFYIPPISTGRRNPFDSPCDSYNVMGLPPIPGSAPSVLAPRRNPFDLPYDSSEEKPDLKGDSFEQEFMAFHQRDILFRRHESFSLGASSFGGSRQEKQHTNWRPYFVPEHMAGEGTSYPIFERQSSGFSDSKASSVPETESVSSAVNEEDTKLIHQDVSQQIEVMSNIDCVPGHVEDGGQSSEDSRSEESDQVEKTEIDLNVIAQAAEEVDHLEIESALVTPIELDMNEAHLEVEAGEEKYSRSSSPRLLEVTDHSFDSKSDEESLILDAGKAETVEKSGVQIQPSQEGSDLSFNPGVVVEHRHKDPVYDSSPPAVEKNLSSSSISSDLAVEMSEIGVATTVSSGMTAPLAYKESELRKEIMDSASGNEEKWATSSQLPAVDENESRSGEIQEMSEHVFTDSSASAADIAPVEVVVMHKDESFQDEQDQGDQFNIGAEFQTRKLHQEVSENMDLMTSRDLNIPSERITLSAVEEQHPSLAVEQVSALHPNFFSSETNLLKETSADKVERMELEHHQLHSSGYDAKIGDNQDVDEKLVSMDVCNLFLSEAKSVEGNSTGTEESIQIGQEQLTPPSSDAKPGDQQVEEKLESVDVSNLYSLETKAMEEDSMMMEETLQSVPSLASDATTGDQHDVNWKQVSQDFSKLASETKSVEENSSGEVKTLHDQVHAPVSDVNIGDHQNGDEKQVDLEGSDLSSSETKFAEENSRGNIETVQFECDQVQLSSFDAKIRGHQDVNKTLGDDSQNVSSSEMSLSEPEKFLPPSLTDESAVRPSLDYHEDTHEQYMIPAEGTEGVGITDNLKVLRTHLPEDHISSFPSLITVSSEISENRPPSSFADPRYDTVNGTENESHDLSGLELVGFPVAVSHVLDQNVIDNAEEDEIKEFNEHFLAELDRVGDFSVNGVGSNLNEVEERDTLFMTRDSETKNIQVVEDDSNEVDESSDKFLKVEGSDSGFQLFRASSIENVDSSSREVTDGGIRDSKPNQELVMCSEMPLVETLSLEDTDLALKDTEPISKANEVMSAESIPPEFDISSGRVPAIEARSLEDFGLALKDAGPMSRETQVEDKESMRMPSTEEQSLGDGDLSLTNMELVLKEALVKLMNPIVPDVANDPGMLTIEARSLEDIHSALKDAEPMPIDTDVERSHDDINLVLEDAVSRAKETEAEDQHKVSENDVPSGMLVIEARSLEDIDQALKDTELMSKETEVDIEESRVPIHETGMEMPNSEAQSLEDINTALDDAKPRSEESAVPELEISSTMSVLEDHSVADIGTASKKNIEEEDEKPLAVESPVLAKDLELPIVEARSIEDINHAFKQLHDGVDREKPNISGSIDHKRISAEPKYPGEETSSSPQVVEASSLDDVHKALGQALESNPEERVNSSENSQSRTEESGVRSTSAAQTAADHGIGN